MGVFSYPVFSLFCLIKLLFFYLFLFFPDNNNVNTSLKEPPCPVSLSIAGFPNCCDVLVGISRPRTCIDKTWSLLIARWVYKTERGSVLWQVLKVQHSPFRDLRQTLASHWGNSLVRSRVGCRLELESLLLRCPYWKPFFCSFCLFPLLCIVVPK